MSEFWLGALGLVLLSAAFLIGPGWLSRGDRRPSLKRDNLSWFALRQRELRREQATAAVLDDAALRLIEDDVDALTEEDRPVASRGGLWLLLPLAVVSAGLYAQLGALEDLRLSRALQALDQTADSDVHALMGQIAVRAKQRPENLHYRAMLGRYYLGSGAYDKAREVYLGLVEAAPGDAAALALAAQAGYLAAGRVLDADSQRLAERALNANPQERTALGLLGMAAFEKQQFRAAISYWQRLLALEEPGSAAAQLIEGVESRAYIALGEEPPARENADLRSGVSVLVQLPEAAQVPADAVLFVFARDPAVASRRPVAVQRLPAAGFPLIVRLDDAHSMTGQKLSRLSQVSVIARISGNGQPGEEHALWQGQIGPLEPAADNVLHKLPLTAKKI